MRVLVSHSFGLHSDDWLAQGIRTALERRQFDVPCKSALQPQMEYVDVWDEDIADLRRSFRRAGFEPPWQERSDPALPKKLFEFVRDCDVFVAIWSEDYAWKYWTTFEWNTAVALAKCIVIVDVGTADLPVELGAAVDAGRLSRLRLGVDYGASTLVRAVESSFDRVSRLPSGLVDEVRDEALGLHFSRLSHPHLGPIEVSQTIVPSRDPARASTESSARGGRRQVYTFREAMAFCDRAGVPGRYRPPFEGEWEFAARAGDAGWSGIDAREGPAPGSFTNGFGLTFTGEAEWCANEVYLSEYNGWINPARRDEDGEWPRAIRCHWPAWPRTSRSVTDRDRCALGGLQGLRLVRAAAETSGGRR